MNKIIEEAIETFNLTKLEEYYLDSNNRIRARGFIYDECTGIFLNECGLLEFEAPILEEGKEGIREIFNFKIEESISFVQTEMAEASILEKAVA